MTRGNVCSNQRVVWFFSSHDQDSLSPVHFIIMFLFLNLHVLLKECYLSPILGKNYQNGTYRIKSGARN